MKVAVGIFSTPVWTLDAKYVATLRERFPGVEFQQAFSAGELDAIIADADVAFSSMVRASTFAHARNLKWIHSSAAGVGASLFPALVESDVILTNSRGVQSDSIAEHVIALMLAWRRGVHTAVRRQVARTWTQDELSTLSPPRLADTRVLIVGHGSIGRRVEHHCAMLGMKVTPMRRTYRDGIAGMDALPIELPEHDIVVITAPHTPETDRLFDAAMLARMLPGSLLINVGRGRIVDETALIAALEQGRPGGAALDVFEREPLAAESPLWDMENVIITPHVAGFGERFWEGLVDLFAANLKRWLDGKPLENVVEKQRGY